MVDKIVQEGDFWVVYRYSETWGKCPIFKTKEKTLAEYIIS